MDFMRLIKSLEEFLYEIMVWLIFYPRTLWWAVTQPNRLMEYADKELEDADEDRYSDTLSPPIFLALTLLIVHFFEKASPAGKSLTGFMADDEKLLAVRIISFSMFPLIQSFRLLRLQKIPLDRKTLKAPFFGQCFIAAPFALGVDIGAVIGSGNNSIATAIALTLMIVTTIWYLVIQSIWFSDKLGVSRARGAGHAAITFFEAVIICSFIGAGVSYL